MVEKFYLPWQPGQASLWDHDDGTCQFLLAGDADYVVTFSKSFSSEWLALTPVLARFPGIEPFLAKTFDKTVEPGFVHFQFVTDKEGKLTNRSHDTVTVGVVKATSGKSVNTRVLGDGVALAEGAVDPILAGVGQVARLGCLLARKRLVILSCGQDWICGAVSAPRRFAQFENELGPFLRSGGSAMICL